MAESKNKSALLIALGGSKKGGDAPPDDDSPGAEEIKDVATDDVMSAMESGDRDGLKDALTRFVRACTSEGYDDEEMS